MVMRNIILIQKAISAYSRVEWFDRSFDHAYAHKILLTHQIAESQRICRQNNIDYTPCVLVSSSYPLAGFGFTFRYHKNPIKEQLAALDAAINELLVFRGYNPLACAQTYLAFLEMEENKFFWINHDYKELGLMMIEYLHELISENLNAIQISPSRTTKSASNQQ